jgi:hypothetical protein
MRVLEVIFATKPPELRLTRVADSDSLNPDPAFQANPDPGSDDQKLKKTAEIFFYIFFFFKH